MHKSNVANRLRGLVQALNLTEQLLVQVELLKHPQGEVDSNVLRLTLFASALTLPILVMVSL